MTQKVALIGTGMVADMHVAAIRDCAGVDLHGVASRDAAKAETFAARHDIPKTYPAVSDALDDPVIDFAILLTPPDARDKVARACVDRGLPLLTEKPLERDLPRAQALVEMFEAANVPFGVVLQHRMRPAARTLRNRLAEGVIGQIATVDLRVPWWRDQSYYDAPGRGTFARDGGGVLITQAIHTIDMMLACAGPVAEVQAMVATSAQHRLEAEDFAAAALRFESGAVGSLVASVTHYPGGAEEITLNGTQGSATLSASQLVIRRPGKTDEVIGASAGTGGGADPMAFSHDWHRDVIADFAASLTEGRPPAIPARAALAAHALIDAIQASSRSGRRETVKVPEC